MIPWPIGIVWRALSERTPGNVVPFVIANTVRGNVIEFLTGFSVNPLRPGL
jgi:hypothetical protein